MGEHERLQWRCRRGTRELDLMLRGYLDGHYVAASSAQRQAFERLLERPDPELHALLIGVVQSSDREIQHVIRAIRGESTTPT